MTDKKNGVIYFYIFYFVIFCLTSIVGSFMSMYLANHGVEQSLIGYINGAIQLTGLVIFPLAGRIADKTKTKNVVLNVGLIIALVCLYFFYKSTTPFMLGVMMIAYSSVINPMAIIYETITVDVTAKLGLPYAPIRMTGTIGFSIMAAIAGFFLASKEELMFPILIALLILTIIISFLLPKSANEHKALKEEKIEEEKAVEKKSGDGVYSMLKDREVLSVMILFGVYNLTAGFNMAYYGVYMQELGGNYFFVGIANMLLGFSEIPFHIGKGRAWMKSIGVLKAMMVCTIVGVFRWTICAITRSPYVLVMTDALNGIMLVPCIVDLIEYLYAKAPDHLKTSVQTGLRSPFQVGGMLISLFGGGFLVGVFSKMNMNGIRIVYVICSVICALALVYVYFANFRKKTDA